MPLTSLTLKITFSKIRQLSRQFRLYSPTYNVPGAATLGQNIM